MPNPRDSEQEMDIQRYRVLKEETTAPVAFHFHDEIVSELEADFKTRMAGEEPA